MLTTCFEKRAGKPGCASTAVRCFGEANVVERTFLACGFEDGGRNAPGGDQGVNFARCGPCGFAECRSEIHFPTAFAVGMKNGPARNDGLEHFLKAQGLGAQLGIIVVPSPAFAELELDWEKRAVGPFLDDVTLAAEAEGFGPNGKRAKERDAFCDFVTRKVGVLVDDIATGGVLVCRAPSFDKFQCGPSRAVEIVVEEGEGQQFPILRWNL